MSDVDEFSFLPAQAADGGIDRPIPPVHRLHLTLDDGRTLSALRYGDAPPEVTLLHGAGLNAHTWDTTVLALGRPALALDLAGHGDSSWRDDAAYVPRVLAPDVVAALEAWTDRPQVLVGQSLGGLTAPAVALAHEVRALVIVDITPGVDPDAGPTQIRQFFAGPTDWASRDELVDRALQFGLGGGSREKAERGVFLNSRVRADGRVEWKHHFAHLAAAAANADSGESPRNVDAAPPSSTDAGESPRSAGGDDAVRTAISASGWDDLAAVTAPITLVRGDRGYVTEADAAEFARHIPTAYVVTLSSGHNVQEDAPVALAELLAGVAR